jgi:hypothetical protein
LSHSTLRLFDARSDRAALRDAGLAVRVEMASVYGGDNNTWFDYERLKKIESRRGRRGVAAAAAAAGGTDAGAAGAAAAAGGGSAAGAGGLVCAEQNRGVKVDARRPVGSADYGVDVRRRHALVPSNEISPARADSDFVDVDVGRHRSTKSP